MPVPLPGPRPDSTLSLLFGCHCQGLRLVGVCYAFCILFEIIMSRRPLKPFLYASKQKKKERQIKRSCPSVCVESCQKSLFIVVRMNYASELGLCSQPLARPFLIRAFHTLFPGQIRGTHALLDLCVHELPGWHLQQSCHQLQVSAECPSGLNLDSNCFYCIPL